MIRESYNQITIILHCETSSINVMRKLRPEGLSSRVDHGHSAEYYNYNHIVEWWGMDEGESDYSRDHYISVYRSTHTCFEYQ